MVNEAMKWFSLVDLHSILQTRSNCGAQSLCLSRILFMQVSTGQPHEGSSYASQKVLQMAWHRLEHARSRVAELDRLKGQHSGRQGGAQRQLQQSSQQGQ